MKEKVYIETSVISYLCARPSRDLIAAARQQTTREWWDKKRVHYDMFVSAFVLKEIDAGDRDAAERRRLSVVGVPLLAANPTVELLASTIMEQAHLPVSVSADVAHIAIASMHQMDYLLTWNCAHIANPHWQGRLSAVVCGLGYRLPVICTPDALMEDR